MAAFAPYISILFLNYAHLILPPALFLRQLFMQIPLKVSTFFSVLLDILLQQCYKMISKLKMLAVAGITMTVGVGFAYRKLEVVNAELGEEFIDFTVSAIRNRETIDQQASIGSTKMQLMMEELVNQIQIWSKKIQTYAYRLIYTQEYRQVCENVRKRVLKRILNNYQKEGIFQHEQLFQAFEEQSNFNNKLTKKIMGVQKKNEQLRKQNIFLLQKFNQLQQELLTIRILGISNDQQHKIDLIYNYLKSKERYLQNLKATQQTPLPQQSNNTQQLQKIDYSSKLEYL